MVRRRSPREQWYSTPGGRITFTAFLWRFTTGAFIDGKPRLREVQQTWWSRKPRWKRALWRWGVVGLLLGGIVGARLSPTWRVNAFLMCVGEFFPVLSWQIGVFIANRIQPVKLIVVRENLEERPPRSIADIGDASEVVDMVPPHELRESNEILTDMEVPIKSEAEMAEEFADLTRPRRNRRKLGAP